MSNQFLYNPKTTVLTKTEQNFMNAINKALPKGCILLVQQTLSSIVEKNDDSKFRNELFRIVDFLVVDTNYKPLFCIEINDSTHEDYKRRNRDQKVHDILEEAGIPLVTLWTKYGVNEDYIEKRIFETLTSLPIKRVHHFNIEEKAPKQPTQNNVQYIDNQPTIKKGCYIATCVYNSYDCPEVWTLRRFRDEYLEKYYLGRLFIRCYYFISPKIVDILGGFNLFRKLCKLVLDRFVQFLNNKGFNNNKYDD